MNVDAILQHKGGSVATVSPSASVSEAVALLRKKGIGALVVSSDGVAPEGMLSERDVVRGLAQEGAQLLERRVEEVMTRAVVTCGLADRLADLMALMTERRIRHLPVMHGGKLVGLVSIGDVVKNRLDEIESEAHSLKTYIAGAA
jgi:CBS domain-containing protein